MHRRSDLAAERAEEEGVDHHALPEPVADAGAHSYQTELPTG